MTDMRLDRPRLLQCGDIVMCCGQRGEVVGVDLRNPEPTAVPLFVIELADGSTAYAETGDVEVLEPSPAPDAATYLDGGKSCH